MFLDLMVLVDLVWLTERFRIAWIVVVLEAFPFHFSLVSLGESSTGLKKDC